MFKKKIAVLEPLRRGSKKHYFFQIILYHNNMQSALKVILVVFISAVVVRVFLLDSFIVQGDSMAPNILPGDYVFVSKSAYRFKEPKRGDIIVARPKAVTNGSYIIKRIIAIPGEIIEIAKDKVTIKSSREDQGVVLTEPYIANIGTPEVGINQINIDPYEYFVLGDNRYASIDSREIGSVNSWDIKGKVFFLFRLKSFSFKLF